MKLSKKALILAAVVGVSSSALAAPSTCNVRFQNTLITQWPEAVVSIGVGGGQFLHQSGVGTTVVSAAPGSTITFSYQVGVGADVDAVGGLISAGDPPTSVMRTTWVHVDQDCNLSMPLQRLLLVPHVGTVTVGIANNNTVSFAPGPFTK